MIIYVYMYIQDYVGYRLLSDEAIASHAAQVYMCNHIAIIYIYS